MFYILKTYLYYLSKATNQHGVHSPFVYNFITRCLYLRSSKSQVQKHRACRRYFKELNQRIEVKDFGAGSKVFRGEKRSVSKIATVAGIKEKYALLLMRMVLYFKPTKVLEIGTSLGIASHAIKSANPKVQLTTLEGCEQTLKIAQKQFNFFKFDAIVPVLGAFENTLEGVVNDNTYDMIFFDGNHTAKATISYFEQSLSAIHNDSVFIFDDIHWTEDMENAWAHIKKHPRVTVTIDLFQWGVVFFRKEQQKEHFTIRF